MRYTHTRQMHRTMQDILPLVQMNPLAIRRFQSYKCHIMYIMYFLSCICTNAEEQNVAIGDSITPQSSSEARAQRARCCSSNRMMDWCPPRDARRYAVSPILQEDDDTRKPNVRYCHTQPAFSSAAASTCARIALARLLVVDAKLEQQAHNGLEASEARVKQRIPALTAREVEAGGCG